MFELLWESWEQITLNNLAKKFRLGLGDRSLEGEGVQFRLFPMDDKENFFTCEYYVELPSFPFHLSLSHEDLSFEGQRTHTLTGDIDFDDVLPVVTDRREEALAYLTNDRRGLLLQCLYPFGEATIERGKVKGTFLYTSGGLESRVRHFLHLRDYIKQPPPRRQRRAGWVRRGRERNLGWGLVLGGSAWMAATYYFLDSFQWRAEYGHLWPVFLTMCRLVGLANLFSGIGVLTAMPQRRLVVVGAALLALAPVMLAGMDTFQHGRFGLCWGMVLVGLLWLAGLIWLDRAVRRTEPRA